MIIIFGYNVYNFVKNYMLQKLTFQYLSYLLFENQESIDLFKSFYLESYIATL